MASYIGYSRFSTDNQRDDSIDDQNRNLLRKYAGMGIPEKQVLLFHDKAITGTHDDRPGYQAAMRLVEKGGGGIFIVDDQSRLTRGLDIGEILEKFRFHGFRFIAINDNIDTAREGTEVTAQIKGVVNNISIKDHAKRVHRGLEGRALDVYGSTGVLPYGYNTDWADPVEGANYVGNGPKPKRVVLINNEEAEIVKLVFSWFVVIHYSLNKIARKLNAMGVSTGRRSKAKDWSAGRVRRLLKNKKYFGKWEWGANKTVRYKGKRRNEAVNKDKRTITMRPHLAIITEDMWNAADARFGRFKEIAGPNAGKSQHSKRGRYAREYPFNLLSGSLFCGECGVRLHRGAGNGGCYYRCPTHFNNSGACGSKSSVNKDKAEQVIIGFLAKKLEEIDGWIGAVHERMLFNLEEYHARVPTETARLLQRKAELDQEIDTLLDNLKHHKSPRLAAEFSTSESALERVNKELETLERKAKAKPALPSRNEVAKALSDLLPIFSEEPTRGALLLRRIIGKITVTDVIFPGKQRGYAKLTFQFDPRRLLAAVYNDDTLFNADEGPSMAEEVVLYTGEPSKTEALMPQIHEWVTQGVAWVEIRKRTGLSASNAATYYKRWRQALAEAESDSGVVNNASALPPPEPVSSSA